MEVSGHQKEVDSEGGVVAEVHREGEVVQEVDLGQEGRLLSNPTGTKVSAWLFVPRPDVYTKSFAFDKSFVS